MFKQIQILVALLIISSSSMAQVNVSKMTLDSSSIYKNLDTLTFYNVNLRYQSSGKFSKYWVNDKLVSEEIYSTYKIASDNIGLCTPCYLKTYDINNKLIEEGAQYTDCKIGIWIEYYPNGNVKLVGHYTQNDTENWENLWDRGYCSKREGLWTYYNKNGTIAKTEMYEDGKLL